MKFIINLLDRRTFINQRAVSNIPAIGIINLMQIAINIDPLLKIFPYIERDSIRVIDKLGITTFYITNERYNCSLVFM
jgi:hypothetical protein